MTDKTDTPTPWLTVREAAQRARVGPKTIYREIRRAPPCGACGWPARTPVPAGVDRRAWLDQTAAVVMVGRDHR